MLITLLVSQVLGSPQFEKCEKYIFVWSKGHIALFYSLVAIQL
jgi:hypothetical protein